MFKQIRSDFIEIREYFSQAITTITATTKIRLLIFMANLMQKAYNRRFFVSIIDTQRGERLKIFDNQMFKTYKRLKWLPKRMTTLDLEQKCFYATSLSRNNNVAKEDRNKAIKKYVNYTKTIRKVNKLRMKSAG